MSMSINNAETEDQPGRFAFHHFDQECDFGVENADGERVRKRKRPGRKPNPPTIQERRAQNRAAQKAFRERIQQKRQEKEQQWKSYSQEIKRLKKKLAIVQYEARYLKACVLHLTLASLIHRGSVPHIWTESRIIPSNSHGEYKKPYYAPYGQNIYNEAYQTPALLDMMLDNHCIVDFDQALLKSTQHNYFTEYKKRTGSDITFATFQDYIVKDIITINMNSQDPKAYFPKLQNQRLRSPSPEVNLSMPSSPQPTSDDCFSETHCSSQPSADENKKEPSCSTNTTEATSKTPSSNAQNAPAKQKPVTGVIFEPPSFKTPEDLSQMLPLQALHILRLQMKLGSILGDMTASTLLPTALQRIIPHDIRIDFVPGASIRDRMIIFQDYYDMDECFNYLTQNTVFIGGDIRDTRNWVLGPEYSVKFWFLSHQLVDQSYDDCLHGQELILLNEELRKMYALQTSAGTDDNDGSTKSRSSKNKQPTAS